MPATNTALPRMSIVKREKKFDSVATSPSIRSISWPGVWSLWNVASSESACRKRSRRRALVAVQATVSPT